MRLQPPQWAADKSIDASYTHSTEQTRLEFMLLWQTT
jgi:hypothetical protein